MDLHRLVFHDDDFAPIEIFSENSQEVNLEPSQAEEVDFVELERTEKNDFDDGTLSIDDLNQTDPLSTQLGPVANRDASPLPSTSASKPLVTPEMVRPYPKIIRSENTGKQERERGKSGIYTESPEKTRLQMLADEKARKEELKLIKKKAKELKTAKKLLGLSEPSKRKKQKMASNVVTDSDSTDASLKLTDTDDDACILEQDEIEQDFDAPKPENIKIGDFLLVKFEKKKSVAYYVAKVISKYGVSEYEVSYLRKRPRTYIFVFPNVEDRASVDFNDVVLVLPKPNFSKGTARTSSMFTFSINFSGYDIQ